MRLCSGDGQEKAGRGQRIVEARSRRASSIFFRHFPAFPQRVAASVLDFLAAYGKGNLLPGNNTAPYFPGGGAFS
jgi:hypothetical protein